MEDYQNFLHNTTQKVLRPEVLFKNLLSQDKINPLTCQRIEELFQQQLGQKIQQILQNQNSFSEESYSNIQEQNFGQKKFTIKLEDSIIKKDLESNSINEDDKSLKKEIRNQINQSVVDKSKEVYDIPKSISPTQNKSALLTVPTGNLKSEQFDQSVQSPDILKNQQEKKPPIHPAKQKSTNLPPIDIMTVHRKRMSPMTLAKDIHQNNNLLKRSSRTVNKTFPMNKFQSSFKSERKLQNEFEMHSHFNQKPDSSLGLQRSSLIPKFQNLNAKFTPNDQNLVIRLFEFLAEVSYEETEKHLPLSISISLKLVESIVIQLIKNPQTFSISQTNLTFSYLAKFWNLAQKIIKSAQENFLISKLAEKLVEHLTDRENEYSFLNVLISTIKQPDQVSKTQIVMASLPLLELMPCDIKQELVDLIVSQLYVKQKKDNFIADEKQSKHRRVDFLKIFTLPHKNLLLMVLTSVLERNNFKIFDLQIQQQKNNLHIYKFPQFQEFSSISKKMDSIMNILNNNCFIENDQVLTQKQDLNNDTVDEIIQEEKKSIIKNQRKSVSFILNDQNSSCDNLNTFQLTNNQVREVMGVCLKAVSHFFQGQKTFEALTIYLKLAFKIFICVGHAGCKEVLAGRSLHEFIIYFLMKALLAKEDHNSEDMTPNHLNQKKEENINGGQNKLLTEMTTAHFSVFFDLCIQNINFLLGQIRQTEEFKFILQAREEINEQINQGYLKKPLILQNILQRNKSGETFSQMNDAFMQQKKNLDFYSVIKRIQQLNQQINGDRLMIQELLETLALFQPQFCEANKSLFQILRQQIDPSNQQKDGQYLSIQERKNQYQMIDIIGQNQVGDFQQMRKNQKSKDDWQMQQNESELANHNPEDKLQSSRFNLVEPLEDNDVLLQNRPIATKVKSAVNMQLLLAQTIEKPQFLDLRHLFDRVNALKLSPILLHTMIVISNQESQTIKLTNLRKVQLREYYQELLKILNVQDKKVTSIPQSNLVSVLQQEQKLSITQDSLFTRFFMKLVKFVSERQIQQNQKTKPLGFNYKNKSNFNNQQYLLSSQLATLILIQKIILVNSANSITNQTRLNSVQLIQAKIFANFQTLINEGNLLTVLQLYADLVFQKNFLYNDLTKGNQQEVDEIIKDHEELLQTLVIEPLTKALKKEGLSQTFIQIFQLVNQKLSENSNEQSPNYGFRKLFEILLDATQLSVQEGKITIKIFKQSFDLLLTLLKYMKGKIGFSDSLLDKDATNQIEHKNSSLMIQLWALTVQFIQKQSLIQDLDNSFDKKNLTAKQIQIKQIFEAIQQIEFELSQIASLSPCLTFDSDFTSKIKLFGHIFKDSEDLFLDLAQNSQIKDENYQSQNVSQILNQSLQNSQTYHKRNQHSADLLQQPIQNNNQKQADQQFGSWIGGLTGSTQQQVQKIKIFRNLRKYPQLLSSFQQLQQQKKQLLQFEKGIENGDQLSQKNQTKNVKKENDRLDKKGQEKDSPSKSDILKKVEIAKAKKYASIKQLLQFKEEKETEKVAEQAQGQGKNGQPEEEENFVEDVEIPNVLYGQLLNHNEVAFLTLFVIISEARLFYIASSLYLPNNKQPICRQNFLESLLLVHNNYASDQDNLLQKLEHITKTLVLEYLGLIKTLVVSQVNEKEIYRKSFFDSIVAEDIKFLLKARLHVNTKVSHIAGFCLKKYIETVPTILQNEEVFRYWHQCIAVIARQLEVCQYNSISLPVAIPKTFLNNDKEAIDLIYLSGDHSRCQLLLSQLVQAYTDLFIYSKIYNSRVIENYFSALEYEFQTDGNSSKGSQLLNYENYHKYLSIPLNLHKKLSINFSLAKMRQVAGSSNFLEIRSKLLFNPQAALTEINQVKELNGGVQSNAAFFSAFQYSDDLSDLLPSTIKYQGQDLGKLQPFSLKISSRDEMNSVMIAKQHALFSKNLSSDLMNFDQIINQAEKGNLIQATSKVSRIIEQMTTSQKLQMNQSQNLISLLLHYQQKVDLIQQINWLRDQLPVDQIIKELLKQQMFVKEQNTYAQAQSNRLKNLTIDPNLQQEFGSDYVHYLQRIKIKEKNIIWQKQLQSRTDLIDWAMKVLAIVDQGQYLQKQLNKIHELVINYEIFLNVKKQDQLTQRQVIRQIFRILFSIIPSCGVISQTLNHIIFKSKENTFLLLESFQELVLLSRCGEQSKALWPQKKIVKQTRLIDDIQENSLRTVQRQKMLNKLCLSLTSCDIYDVDHFDQIDQIQYKLELNRFAVLTPDSLLLYIEEMIMLFKRLYNYTQLSAIQYQHNLTSSLILFLQELNQVVPKYLSGKQDYLRVVLKLVQFSLSICFQNTYSPLFQAKQNNNYQKIKFLAIGFLESMIQKQKNILFVRDHFNALVQEVQLIEDIKFLVQKLIKNEFTFGQVSDSVIQISSQSSNLEQTPTVQSRTFLIKMQAYDGQLKNLLKVQGLKGQPRILIIQSLQPKILNDQFNTIDGQFYRNLLNDQIQMIKFSLLANNFSLRQMTDINFKQLPLITPVMLKEKCDILLKNRPKMIFAIINSQQSTIYLDIFKNIILSHFQKELDDLKNFSFTCQIPLTRLFWKNHLVFNEILKASATELYRKWQRDPDYQHLVSLFRNRSLSQAISFFGYKYDKMIFLHSISLRPFYKAPSQVAIFYLSQMFQSLRWSTGFQLHKYLTKKSQGLPSMAHNVIWFCRVESFVDLQPHRKVLLPITENLDTESKKLEVLIMSGLNQLGKDYFNIETQFLEKITSISGELQPSQSKDEKKAIIRDRLIKYNKEIPNSVYLPTNQRCRVVGIVTSSGQPMQSAARVPILVSFEVQDYEGPDSDPIINTKDQSNSKSFDQLLSEKSIAIKQSQKLQEIWKILPQTLLQMNLLSIDSITASEKLTEEFKQQLFQFSNYGIDVQEVINELMENDDELNEFQEWLDDLHREVFQNEQLKASKNNGFTIKPKFAQNFNNEFHELGQFISDDPSKELESYRSHRDRFEQLKQKPTLKIKMSQYSFQTKSNPLANNEDQMIFQQSQSFISPSKQNQFGLLNRISEEQEEIQIQNKSMQPQKLQKKDSYGKNSSEKKLKKQKSQLIKSTGKERSGIKQGENFPSIKIEKLSSENRSSDDEDEETNGNPRKNSPGFKGGLNSIKRLNMSRKSLFKYTPASKSLYINSRPESPAQILNSLNPSKKLSITDLFLQTNETNIQRKSNSYKPLIFGGDDESQKKYGDLLQQAQRNGEQDKGDMLSLKGIGLVLQFEQQIFRAKKRRLQKETVNDQRDQSVELGVVGQNKNKKIELIKEEAQKLHGPPIKDPNKPIKIVSCIFKVNDDLRQDILAIQFIKLFQKIFKKCELDLFVAPYKCISNRTGDKQLLGGIIEVVANSNSRDQIGKAFEIDLYEYFLKKYGSESSKAFMQARQNFIKSLAAYSVVSYILQIKDRHNGNILVDDEGHLIHIDFGFIFNWSPGKDMNFESANFKLTKEFIKILGGNAHAEPYQLFVQKTIQGYLAVREHYKDFYNLVELMIYSGFPCFKQITLSTLQQRFRVEGDSACLNQYEAAIHMHQVIQDAHDKWTTNAYDMIQYKQNKIVY